MDARLTDSQARRRGRGQRGNGGWWLLVLGLTVQACFVHPAPATPPPPLGTPASPTSTAPARAAAATVDPERCYSREHAPTFSVSVDTPTRGFEPAPDVLPEANESDQKPPLPDGGKRDKEIIRRIIRRHINQVKSCYERLVLAVHPTVAARVMIAFGIDASGLVTQTHVVSSTIDDPQLSDCIAEAMCGWQFPRPSGGGEMIVTYPYVLTPAGTPPPAPKAAPAAPAPASPAGVQ
jgi:hypothetical protein